MPYRMEIVMELSKEKKKTIVCDERLHLTGGYGEMEVIMKAKKRNIKNVVQAAGPGLECEGFTCDKLKIHF